MTERTEIDTAEALEALQELDDRIDAVRERVRGFEPQILEVEEPALDLESEVGTTRSRIQEMKVEERRLELSADEKRTRIKRLQERLNNVRNVREESAVSAELEMVEQALEGDEQEALTLLDQIRKLEMRLDEQEASLEDARASVEPRRQELLAERDQAKGEIAELESRREAFADEMSKRELRLYERIRSNTGRKAVARLTPDGACGNCFNVLPLQLQNEVRHGGDMVLCEACGVILTSVQAVPAEPDADGAGPEE